MQVVIYFDYELQQGADMVTIPEDKGVEESENTDELIDHPLLHP